MSISKIRTSDGAEHGIDYEGLENKPTSILKDYVVASGIQFGPESQKEFDLSGYIPNDGNNYLTSIMITGTLAANNSIAIYGSTPEDSYPYSYSFERKANNSSKIDYIGNSVLVLIGPSRKFIVYNTNNSGTVTGVTIRCSYYIKA